jgi:hypothetical protein
MATDDYKPKGQAKASEDDSGGGVIRSTPVLGVVKNNIDETRSGRIQVYIADFGGPDPDDSSNWTPVSYMSPFFGNTGSTSGTDSKDYGSFATNPVSYGMWFSPPDIGSTVVCIFINGKPDYGYYIGGVLQSELLHMIPAIGSSSNVTLNEGEASSYGGSTRLPVTNLNNNNANITNSTNYLDAAKPVHSYSAAVFTQQGLNRDTVRGPISSSALRESPSRVGWGVSTPGRPIFQGGFTDSTIGNAAKGSSDESLKIISRRTGHSIVMDDGTQAGQDQLIRIRTALGHQITMSDDGQTLFIIHSNGQSYIELGKEGTIDMYSTNSVNIRTQGDLNLHADNNININAKKNINIASENLKFTTEKNLDYRVGGSYSGYTLGKYSIKVNGTMSMGSGGEGSYASAGDMYINGSKVNLNTGATSATPTEVPAFTITSHTDTLFDSAKGWAAAPGKLPSIVTRAPAHSPWINAGSGVAVSVNNNASANFPSPPSPAVAAANATTSAAPNNPPSPATLSTVPATKATSEALDNNTTAAMISGVAATASAIAPEAVATGTAIISAQAGVATQETAPIVAQPINLLVNNQALETGILTVGEETTAESQTTTSGSTIVVVGSLAQTAQTLEKGSVLKPGSASLVQALIDSGANAKVALAQNLFTGKSGAENLQIYTQNVPAQVDTQVTTFQQAQTSLTESGVITGNEAPGQIAGLVTSASQVSVSETVSFVKNTVNTSTGLTAYGFGNNLTTGAGNSVSQAISSGNFSANLGTNITGGLGSLSASLAGLGSAARAGLSNGIDAARGVASSAFSAITSGWKPLKAGVPQNLEAIAAANDQDQAISQAKAANPSTLDPAQRAARALSDGVSYTSDPIQQAQNAVNSTAMDEISPAQSPENIKIQDAINRMEANGIPAPPTAQVAVNPIKASSATPGTYGAVGQLLGVSPQNSTPGNLLKATLGAIQSNPNTSKLIEGNYTQTLNLGIDVGQTLSGGLTPQVAGKLGTIINSSIAASGIKGLPGGLDSVSSIINSPISSLGRKFLGNTNIPGLSNTSIQLPGLSALQSSISKTTNSIGLPGLTSYINNTFTSAQNFISKQTVGASQATGVGVSTSISNGSISILPNAIEKATNLLPPNLKNQSLMSVISSAFVPAEQAKLQASVNSVGSASPFPVKTATIADTTNARGEIAAQTSNLLGDSRIPAPDFSGTAGTNVANKPNAAAIDSYTNTVERNKILIQSLLAENEAQRNVIRTATAKYKEAKNTLPEGDPEIRSLKAASDAEIDKYSKLIRTNQQKIEEAKNAESAALSALRG